MNADNPITPLAIWTVYFNPADFPGLYVVRRTNVGGGVALTISKEFTGATLEEVRAHIPFGLMRFDRQPDDDRVILETWF